MRGRGAKIKKNVPLTLPVTLANARTLRRERRWQLALEWYEKAQQAAKRDKALSALLEAMRGQAKCAFELGMAVVAEMHLSKAEALSLELYGEGGQAERVRAMRGNMRVWTHQLSDVSMNERLRV